MEGEGSPPDCSLLVKLLDLDLGDGLHTWDEVLLVLLSLQSFLLLLLEIPLVVLLTLSRERSNGNHQVSDRSLELLPVLVVIKEAVGESLHPHLVQVGEQFHDHVDQ